MRQWINRASDALLGGGVIAYPTEGVYGLGCMPDDGEAVARLLAIKDRDVAKGLILIAAEPAQFAGWVADDELRRLPVPDPASPVTWIATPGPLATPLITGDHEGIAVRITTNPIAANLCRSVDAPIVSTSANLSGRPVARNRYLLRRQFGRLVDYVVPGDCGPAAGPSEIRNLKDGKVLRARSS